MGRGGGGVRGGGGYRGRRWGGGGGEVAPSPLHQLQLFLIGRGQVHQDRDAVETRRRDLAVAAREDGRDAVVVVAVGVAESQVAGVDVVVAAVGVVGGGQLGTAPARRRPAERARREEEPVVCRAVQVARGAGRQHVHLPLQQGGRGVDLACRGPRAQGPHLLHVAVHAAAVHVLAEDVWVVADDVADGLPPLGVVVLGAVHLLGERPEEAVPVPADVVHLSPDLGQPAIRQKEVGG